MLCSNNENPSKTNKCVKSIIAELEFMTNILQDDGKVCCSTLPFRRSHSLNRGDFRPVIKTKHNETMGNKPISRYTDFQRFNAPPAQIKNESIHLDPIQVINNVNSMHINSSTHNSSNISGYVSNACPSNNMETKKNESHACTSKHSVSKGDDMSAPISMPAKTTHELGDTRILDQLILELSPDRNIGHLMHKNRPDKEKKCFKVPIYSQKKRTSPNTAPADNAMYIGKPSCNSYGMTRSYAMPMHVSTMPSSIIMRKFTMDVTYTKCLNVLFECGFIDLLLNRIQKNERTLYKILEAYISLRKLSGATHCIETMEHLSKTFFTWVFTAFNINDLNDVWTTCKQGRYADNKQCMYIEEIEDIFRRKLL